MYGSRADFLSFEDVINQFSLLQFGSITLYDCTFSLELLQSHHPFTNRVRLEKLLAKYETKAPCKLLSEKDQGTEFVWPEYESKDDSQAAEGAPISDFAKELVDEVFSLVLACASHIISSVFNVLTPSTVLVG